MSALRRRDEASGRYWRLRARLEVVKAVLWVVFEWWHDGSSGPRL
ncbi:hypothetical protein [Actinomadura logoneensis]|nr:hypothetical protein [Actinomadura logoneensis]